MTIREAMLYGLDVANFINFDIEALDVATLAQSPSSFSWHSTRRVAQELVAEGVLTRVRRGLYRVNRKVLAKKLKGL